MFHGLLSASNILVRNMACGKKPLMFLFLLHFAPYGVSYYVTGIVIALKLQQVVFILSSSIVGFLVKTSDS